MQTMQKLQRQPKSNGLKRFFFVTLALVGFNAFANFSKAPLRWIELQTEIALTTEIIPKSIGVDVYLQNGKAWPSYSGEIDFKKPYCVLQDWNPRFDVGVAADLWRIYKVNSLEGASLFPGFFDDHFEFVTRIGLYDSKNADFAEIMCVKPFEKNFVEMTLGEFETILASNLIFTDLKVKQDLPALDWRPIQLGPKFLLSEFQIKVEKDLTLKVDEKKETAQVTLSAIREPTYEGSEPLSCTLIYNPKDKSLLTESKIVTAGTLFRANHGDIGYLRNNEGILDQVSTIHLRMDELNQMILACKNRSYKRIFDYQDFWDATGTKNGPLSFQIIAN